jgi:oligoribonuclease
MIQSANNLIWIDLEMTGLDTTRDYIIELATVITDNGLRILADGPVIAVHQANTRLSAMDHWNRKHHTESGLIERVRQSRHTEVEAEHMTLEFVRQYVPSETSPMCGNSVCQDRRFLHRFMPRLERYFHYRNLDVSTVKELVRRWAPGLKVFDKASTHRAREDIYESIEELRYYRAQVFRI